MQLATLRLQGLVADNSPDFVEQALACWRRGEAFVVLRAEDDAERIAALQLEVPLPVRVPASGHGWIEGPLPVRADDAVAEVVFTSGTEGKPKGVVLTHRGLADVVARLNQTMHLTSEVREYIGVPVYHSFGFGRCRAVLSAGGKAFIPARGFNPAEINQMLLAGEINAISAVPSLWRILLQSGAVDPAAAKRVRWIEIGSQYMSGAEKVALRQLFSNACIVQHYGLTEASRSTLLEVHRASEAELESVGHALGEVGVRIDGEGRVQIRGPHVAARILTDGEARPLLDSDGWFTTNDRGELRQGALFYLGRADDIINCGGIKLSPDALETQMLASLQSASPGSQLAGKFAVCRRPDAMRGEAILVVAEQSLAVADAELTDAAVVAAARYGVQARGAVTVQRIGAVPRTENGKTKRKELVALFEEVAPTAPRKLDARAPGTGDSLREQLGAILGVEHVKAQDTFVNLGGDSLRFIQAGVVVQRTLGYLPEGWENKPVAELEALPRRIEALARIESSVVLRALAILSVVTNHSGMFHGILTIDGAAMLLLLPSGYSFARFQLRRVLGTGQAWQALTGLPILVVPTVLLTALQQLRHHEVVPSALLLYNNLVRHESGLDYWFIEVLVQLQLGFALLLTFPKVRHVFSMRPFVASVGLVFLGMLGRQLGPVLWNTDHLFNLVPHYLLWNFALGWCALFATTARERLLTTALIAALAAVQVQYPSRALWLVGGGLLLVWVPSVQLPKLIVRGLSVLASASMYIYLVHPLVLVPLRERLPSLGYPGAIIGALAVGVACWYGTELAWRTGRDLVRRVLPSRAVS